MTKYDLKVGYSCNNDCIHCVIRPNVWDIEKRNADISNNLKIDSNYKELIDSMNSHEFIGADTIVITGGEPTIRKEFMKLLRYIKRKYPDKRIVLQTNGRKLKNFVRQIKDEAINTYFIIALHGFENIHNEITDIKKGNAYRETWESIEEIKKVYGDFRNIGRIEIVLSKKNLYEIPDFVEFLYINDIKAIGISYPHLDGYANVDFKLAREIGFSYGELKKIIPRLYNLAVELPDLRLEFEEVPRCMWRDKEDNLYRELPKNLKNMDHIIGENVAVKYPNKNIDTNFNQAYCSTHSKSSVCKDCIYSLTCLGVWEEAIGIYGDEGFIPIKEYELEEEEEKKCI